MFITQDGAPGRYSSEVKLRGSFAATENFFYVRQDPLLELPTGVDVMREQAKDVCGQALAPTTAEREAMIAGVADAALQTSALDFHTKRLCYKPFMQLHRKEFMLR